MIGAELFGIETTATAARAGLAWLLTYAVHGAIAAVVAEVLVLVAHPSAADEHRLWKMALVLPLSTAWLVVLFGGRALGGMLLPALPIVVGSQDSSRHFGPIAWSGGRSLLAGALVATLGVLAGAARFVIGFVRLGKKLADRKTPAHPRLRSSLERVSARFALGRIELTESAQLASPTAVAGRAIYFPADSVASLTDAELDAVLAHELAHLERRDPRWFFFAGLVRAAFWMQPFNHRVIARLRRSAELACDERAVAATGDPLGLARALSRFAHATFSERDGSDAHASLGAARASNALVDRVRRLVAAAPTAVSSRDGAVRFMAAAAILFVAATGSANLTVTFAGTSLVLAAHPETKGLTADRSDTLDVGAASRRAAYLTSQETRLETEIHLARVLAGGDSRSAAASHLLELQQDLRHTREERAWLERSVSDPIAR